MANKMVEMIDLLFTQPREKRPRFTLNKIESIEYNEMGIV